MARMYFWPAHGPTLGTEPRILQRRNRLLREAPPFIVVIPSDRLLKTPFMVLTTNSALSHKIEHLSVRPEPRRRAPKDFSHSLAKREIFLQG